MWLTMVNCWVILISGSITQKFIFLWNYQSLQLACFSLSPTSQKFPKSSFWVCFQIHLFMKLRSCKMDPVLAPRGQLQSLRCRPCTSKTMQSLYISGVTQPTRSYWDCCHATDARAMWACCSGHYASKLEFKFRNDRLWSKFCNSVNLVLKSIN